MKVAVSFLKSDNYKKCIEKIDNSNSDYIHFDFCDGKYVEEKYLSFSETINYLKNTKKLIDAHLMVMEPVKYLDKLMYLNVETITIHPKSCKDVLSTINSIKQMGFKVGIAINPDENIKEFESLFDKIDTVLLMSVFPGKGGQVFIENTLDRFDILNEYKEKYHFLTEVDGGINDVVIENLKSKDVDIVVSGSFITESEDYNHNIASLK